MHPSYPEMPGDAQSELFPPTWLDAEPIRTIISTAPMGVALLQAIRDQSGQITDFRYKMVNPILRALTKHPEEELLIQSLTGLSPDITATGMLARMIQVVNSGHPQQYVEEYHLDGAISRYDQVYIKSGDGLLMLVQDITYSALSVNEQQQYDRFLVAIQQGESIEGIRSMLLALISGQVS